MIVLVRHGETTPNREGLLLGRSDPPLTERGRAQVARLALALADAGVVRVLTSPLGRARETADPIAAACGAAVEVVRNESGETEGRVVAVSHVSPIKAAVTWTLGVSPELAWRMRLDVASITRIARGPVLLTFNET